MALTYSITGGADAAKFNIEANTGKLTFKTAPDFEHPGDADTNNIYIVEVGVSDGTTVTKQVINVTVSNVADENLPPQFTSPAAYTVPENQTTVATLTATDPDAGTPPVEPPVTGDYPNASTTGVKDGVTMTPHSGHLNSTAAGQTIEAKKVSGIVVITHQNVKVRNCEMHNVHAGHEGNAAGLIIEDCTVTGQSWNTGISIVNAGGAIVQRCDISGAENCFWVQAGNAIIRDNWMHAPAGTALPGDTLHIDGVQMPPVGSVQVTHNNFDLPINVSSCIAMSGVQNIKIKNNRIHGGSYCMYFEGASTNCVVEANDFIDYTFGWVAGASYTQQSYIQNTFKGGAPINGLPQTTAVDKAPDPKKDRTDKWLDKGSEKGKRRTK